MDIEHMTYGDYADEEWVDDEDVDDDEDDLLECPSCRSEVYEHTQKCPHCGQWIVPVYPGASRQRWITLAVVLLLVAAMIMIAVF